MPSKWVTPGGDLQVLMDECRNFKRIRCDVGGTGDVQKELEGSWNQVGWLGWMGRQHGRLSLILIGFFGWVVAVPLYGSVGISLATAREVNYAPLPLWFLGANVASSILWGMVWDRHPGWARRGSQVAVALAAVLSLLLPIAPAPLWPWIFALMGLNMGPVVAWGRWFATTVPPGWLGRVFGLTAAGVNLSHWLYDIVARETAPGFLLLGLTLIPLAIGAWALQGFDDTISPSRQMPAAIIDWRIKARTVVRYGLFIIFFSLAAGLAYRFQVVTPVSPYIDDTLRRLPYILAVLTAGVLADRYNLHAVMATGGGVLGLSFLIIGWADQPIPAYLSIVLQGAAFGLLEAAPWLLLAGLSTPGTAGRWFGWGLNMNVVPIFLGGLVALPFANMSPERFGLLAAAATFMAILSLQGVSDPLVILHRWRREGAREAAETEPAAAAPAAGIQPVTDLLAESFGDRLSHRELEVGQLAVLGVATRDIAQQLYLSENTVKTHLKSLYRKTGAINRNDLYRRLVEGEQPAPGRAG